MIKAKNVIAFNVFAHRLVSGKEYTLTLTYAVDGIAKSPVSVVNTCP